MKGTVKAFQLIHRPLCSLKAIIPLLALLLFSSVSVRADQYRGNGNTGFDGAIGNGTLTLSDEGTNISGTLTAGASMNDVLVLYIQSGPGGFTNTSDFNDQSESCRQAISGVSAAGRSLLTFASGFQPNYALALAPAVAGTGGLWQLANGGNNSLVYLGSVNLAPLNNSGPYTFSFPAALIGMIPGVRSTIQVFGTYVRTDGYRSTEAIAGNLTGVQGWNSTTQSAYASYTFDAGAVLVKLPQGIWAQRPNSPAARGAHVAVWTGSEMIVWGGNIAFNPYYANDGGRYNPVANSWTMLPATGAPVARCYHTAVWTGTEMIVWGGADGTAVFRDGGRYNPTANSWMALPTSGAPVARELHSAVWTGSDMIVWGGYRYSGASTYYLNDGGRYNPVANSWTALPTTGAPGARRYHTAVWTGSEMIVWGGASNTAYYADGGRYNPTANSWVTLPTTDAPAGRQRHTAVWTGSDMIVWGGTSNTTYYDSGGRYSSAINSWTALPTSGAPAGRREHTAVWTGSEMIVWGGYTNGGPFSYNDGGRYNPVANSWTPMPTSGASGARYSHTAVWTGSEMIVWGGYNYNTGSLNDGGRYNPTADSWTAVLVNTPPAKREMHTAVWTGSEMIVWGGVYDNGSSGISLMDGGRYDPAANIWTALPTAGAPTRRCWHTAVWTGSEMIVWGGYCYGGPYQLNDGGRYSPAVNSWTGLPATGAPTARYSHTAVWTGSEMIVWGGTSGNSCFNDGGRYSPAANSWTGLPTTGAPTARCNHTAVWTGSEMIVWGGYNNGYYYSDVGRYDPSANSWTALPTNGAPAGRSSHTAVWTGHQMIVWGGYCNTSPHSLNDGGCFDPIGNTWTAIPTNGAPAARYLHTAVWTGNEMIVWGGTGNGYFNDGGRYIPAGGSWTAVPGTSTLDGRWGHTAIWTGSEMIIWGGYNDSRGYFSDTWSYDPYAPAVRISPSGPATAVVAWPVWSSALRLCQTTNLAANQWTTVTNTVTQVGSENHVTLSPLTGSQFFRAEYP